MNDGTSFLLRELADARAELSRAQTRVRQLTASRDAWREKAMTQTPKRRAYMRAYMQARRANG